MIENSSSGRLSIGVAVRAIRQGGVMLSLMAMVRAALIVLIALRLVEHRELGIAAA